MDTIYSDFDNYDNSNFYLFGAAFARESIGQIGARGVFVAVVRSQSTLVHRNRALVSVAHISLVANAFVSRRNVGAIRIERAFVDALGTFVNFFKTMSPVSVKSFIANASESTRLQ